MLDLNIADPTEFENMADELLNNYVLRISNTNYRIHEIEFYLQSHDHPDPYVHCDRRQLTIGEWYFHKRGGTYKGRTYKGLDCSFGRGAYGGILIRAIGTAEHMLEGPCVVVDHILHSCGKASITELVAAEDDNLGVFTTRQFALVYAPDLVPKYPVYQCRRVGLTPGRAPIYAAAPYRYLTCPHRIKKDRQSLKDGLAENHGLSAEEIRQLLSGK